MLLDVYLPDMTGLDVLRRLRAGGRRSDVIVISAARDVDSIRSALHGGVLHYLVKPFDRRTFEARLQDYARLHGELAGLDDPSPCRPSLLCRAAAVPEEDDQRDGDGCRTCKRADSGGAVAAEHPNGYRETDGRRTAEAEQREPAGPTIAPRAEGMHERNGPSGVGEKVEDPPGAVADPRAHEARYEEREQEIERHGSKTQPDRPVR